MTIPKKESLVDEVLLFANSELENRGARISNLHFNFDETEEDFREFLQRNPEVAAKDLQAALNICLSRKLLKCTVMGVGQHTRLELTEDGQGRAISVAAAKHIPRDTSSQSGDINIGTLNALGNTQVGNQNIQSIENALVALTQRIDDSDASDEEKAEAKGRLDSFLRHPLVSALLGAGAALAGSS